MDAVFICDLSCSSGISFESSPIGRTRKRLIKSTHPIQQNTVVHFPAQLVTQSSPVWFLNESVPCASDKACSVSVLQKKKKTPQRTKPKSMKGA